MGAEGGGSPGPAGCTPSIHPTPPHSESGCPTGTGWLETKRGSSHRVKAPPGLQAEAVEVRMSLGTAPPSQHSSVILNN